VIDAIAEQDDIEENDTPAAWDAFESEFGMDADRLEPEPEIEGEPISPPVHPLEEAARHSYWRAQGLIQLERSYFTAAVQEGRPEGARSAYFRLAVYHGRTIYILRSALNAGKETLAKAAIGNLATLHRAMADMHREAAHNVPIPLVLDRRGRDAFARDLLVRALSENPKAMTVDDMVKQVNELELVEVRPGTVKRHLKNLVASGHVDRVEERPARYARSGRAYAEMDIDGPSLRALAGQTFYDRLVAEGFRGLSDILARQSAFRQTFSEITGMDETTAVLFIDLAETLLEDRIGKTSPWSHADLVNSPYPRPYQYEAYAVFRGYGYQGQLVEAPTGSGKTMIGMMCIQDWLRNLRSGQSILVLVPTSNYQQQWTGELCYKPIGLNLSPEMVFAGTPNQLEKFQKRTGFHPAILLMTYTALAQAGSGRGKGGFDIDSIEMFLQGANVQYVILDEVHKVAEDMRSVSADVTRLMMEWLEDGSVRGLIGFTGTAEAYRDRFQRLGLHLVYNIPIDELVAAGFVAPFAEMGVPFSYSARERRIRRLLDAYKAQMVGFMEMVGSERLRGWFAEIPLEERLSLGHEVLNMYRGRKDWETALRKRLTGWEAGGNLKLTEVKLVTLVQMARRWSDEAMAREAGVDPAAFQQLLAGISELRSALAELIYLPTTLARLQQPDFGLVFDVEALLQARAAARNQAARNEAVKDGLAAIIVGLYEGLSEWYRRVGEGRVESIKAIIEAERATRPVSGVIIFDNARRIHWKEALAAPGYEGLGGLYAQMLGDPRFTPYAVLSSEQYLPYSEEAPLPPRVAAFVEQNLMRGEIATAMFDLAAQNLDVPEVVREDLQRRWDALVAAYIPLLADVHAARTGEFSRKVLQPLRRTIRKDIQGSDSDRLLARLNLRNVHFANLVHTFFDYAIIARYFRQARVAELEQVSGARQKFFVIPMPGGSRKQLMYDLTSRIVDAEDLPINMVIVSSWARTGWNVISPNVLIDATATRNVTAWQQLRGRAIRARRTWTNDCYRLIMALIGSQMEGLVEEEAVPEDVLEIVQQTQRGAKAPVLDDKLQALLNEAAPRGLRAKVKRGGIEALSEEERTEIAIALMRHFNKVTHIFELIKAFGSTTQIAYNRPEKRWERRPNIAAKHALEISVNPFTGRKSMDDSHAPLIYAKDPRTDIPADLQRHLTGAIAGRDSAIVAGWLA
jgi:superfamily II DNA or RNA helicase